MRKKMQMFGRSKTAPAEVAPSSPRAALGHAQDGLAVAERKLTAAAAAIGRARPLLEQIVREGERLDADDRRDAEALADKLREVISAGASPSFGSSDRDGTKALVTRAEIDARRAATERATAGANS
jgi:hypothetical protein